MSLFKLIEMRKLLAPTYNYQSHTFNPAVIASYFNLLEYPNEVTDKYVFIQRRMDNVFLLLDKDFDISPMLAQLKKRTQIFCEEKTLLTSKKFNEVTYDLDELFSSNEKNIRRGKIFHLRKDVTIRDSEVKDKTLLESIYSDWVEHKHNDSKVFQISFNPKRYLRTYLLKPYGFNIYEKIIYVKEKPYAVINFVLDKDRAFELSFVSRFFDKQLKIINDLNECIIINSFFDLWKNHGIKTINVGPTAGIKGLTIFKNKMPSKKVTIYRK